MTDPASATTNAAPPWRENLQRLGIALPAAAAPVAAYVPAVRAGCLIYTSGQLPIAAGSVAVTGLVGKDVSLAEAAEAARMCAVNALAAVHELVGLDAVKQIVKVVGFVASAPGFTDQPQVVDGASQLLQQVFGRVGQHARSAVGVAQLPKNAAVEVELIVEVAGEGLP